jgi:endonuclease YncB( thermonuclease family)
MNKKKEVLLLVFLIFLLFAVNYRFLDTKVIEFLDESDTGIVERVIDGDTIVVDNNTHVRLLGINTPEKNEFYYQEAKDFLNNLTLNKTIKLEYGKEREDLYGRTLAYIILDGKNINIEQVRNGFANLYIYNNDKYTSELRQAWNECIAKEINLCEKSNDECADCIELKELNVKNQTAVLHNNCSFDCSLAGWNIKDEGRKNFFFPNFILKQNKEVKIIVGNKTDSENVLYWTGKDYVWTSTGDTLFLRDEKGGLVFWKNY